MTGAGVYPDDSKAQFDADLAMHLSGRTEKLDCEHKIITCHGEERWVLCRGVAVRDDKGRAIRLAGSLSDITRQKQSETELIKQARHDRLTGPAEPCIPHGYPAFGAGAGQA